MKLPTDSQWARYSALCARLQPLPAAARVAALQELRAEGADDPQVLSLVALHYALPPDPDRDRTGERLGTCTLEEPLGVGGMGIVYRAQQHLGPAQRPVAVKLIHPALLRTARAEAFTQFLAELHTLVTLQHAGIARIYDGGLSEDPCTHEPLPYLVMELVRGGLPLTTYARDYALPWRERLALVLRVCRAVEYAHEHRVVHRDLKPANILVDPEGHPMVIDFGLACTSDALLPGAHLVAAGTPAYMSPEQVSDAFGPISAKSDVYALGLLLYELLTEQLPYVLPHANAVEALCQVITETVPPPLCQYDPAYGGELDALVAAALAKRPAERPSVAVLRARLERALQTHTPASAQLWQDTRQPPREPTGAPSRERAPGVRPPEAERRQLTILFCDLVASTALATQLDPEDLREVIRAYHTACAEVIQRCAGHIAQYLGDGLLVYFGYPQAQEDDAQRAVHTGVGLVAAMGPLNTRLEPAYGIRLAVRVGIHTGLVVVGALGDRERQEPLALGETPNLAARLQDLAVPDTVVMSAATARLVEGYFVCQPLGAQALKGIATPVHVSQVLRASGAQSRLDIVPPRGVTPLVGRDDEVALLHRRWEQATRGQGQVVLLSGEPGIGKSRLVQVLQEHVAAAPHVRMEWRGSPDHQQSALAPVIAQLHRRLRWQPDTSPSERLRTLEAALAASGVVLAEAVPLLAALLTLPLPDTYAPLPLTPQRQRQQTLELLLAWLHADAQRQPVLLIVEDLHWLDPSTMELLSVLMDQSAERRLCLVLTARPEFHPPWPMGAHLSVLTLRRRAPAQIARVTTHVAGGKALPLAVLQEVVRMTDGVPLFVEELTKTILEAGLLEEHEDGYTLPGPLPPLAIPATLQDALLARLDRLAAAKGVAQLGATIGRTFAYAVLHAVSPWDETALQHGLRQLEEAELLSQRGVPPQATYTFKHALIQETAYQALLKSTRRQYHQRIARVLEGQFPEMAEEQPALLAHHALRGEVWDKAVAYFRQAGEKALTRSAYREAVAAFEQALSALPYLPETRDTREQAIDLRLALRSALQPFDHHKRVLACLREAEAFAAALADPRRLGQISIFLAVHFRNIGVYDQAIASAQRTLALARSSGDVVLHALANQQLGQTYEAQGDYRRAIDCLRQTTASLDGARCHERFGQIFLPAVLSRALLASCYAELGMFPEGSALGDEGLHLAETVGHPGSLMWAYWGIGLLALRQGDLRRALPRLERAMGICQDADLPLAFPTMAVDLGAAYTLGGRVADALPLLTQARERAIAMEWAMAAESPHVQAFCSLPLVEAHVLAGRLEEAHALAERALALFYEYQERGNQAYALRLLGEIAVRRYPPDAAPAETYYRQALALADELGMRPLQAHCHRSLGTLYATIGEQEQARTALTTAIAMYQAMDMTFWLPQTEAVMAQVEKP